MLSTLLKRQPGIVRAKASRGGDAFARAQRCSSLPSSSEFELSRRTLSKGLIAASASAVLGRTVAAQAARIDVEQLLEGYQFPDEFPFRAQDFQRFDEGSDSAFYSSPRFVTHIDDGAINALTRFYEANLPQGPDVAVLDICSSWISHLPKDYSAGRVAGLGMNDEELRANPQLTDYVVQDLNEKPRLPYEAESFDAVLNAVSVDYMTKPLELFQEIHRVLKPGGVAMMSFSNRCFPTKAISVWTQTGDPDHVLIVGSYFHYAGGFEHPKCKDISPSNWSLPFAKVLGSGDPMYVVYGKKEA
ncbi:methyltransferase [Chloropicon primus]|uniref:Methyltransferase n=2 Tax=Chloropicon primus TaxID=1764295 RepID=A0A5B8MMD8_9CHLO|nr:methyltransferase [Chloropicon primus]UPR00408.1 methyltransferase [Chloropicon primus]|eukprot:QDZ21194.1 methyltransferase [Chloropicon primus]